jgi:hypothetical protein
MVQACLRSQAHDARVEIPPWLIEHDRMLTAFGRWAMDRGRQNKCGSAEGNYRSSEVFAGSTVREILIRDFRAASVQRALIQVPESARVILTTWYVPKRSQHKDVSRMVRRLRGWRGFEAELVRALTMFRNLFDATVDLAS